MKNGHFAFYIASLQRGGAERVMRDLAVWLYERGYRITFVTTYLGYPEYDVPHAAWRVLAAEEEAADALEVMYTDERIARILPEGGLQDPEDEARGGIRRVFSGLMPKEQTVARTANLAKRSALLHRIWEEMQPDLILSFMGKNNVMALMTTIGMSVPVVVSSRSNPSAEYASRQLHLSMISTFRRAAGVVVQMKSFADYYPAGIREKCTVIPNAVSPSFLREPYAGEREKVIVAVGSLLRIKNHAMLLKAFARLKPTHPEWRLVIYGEGVERKHLTSLIHALGLRGSVELPGQVEDVAERIYKAGAFVLSSDEEGMPNALLEAMALGIPCVSTDCAGGGAKELIRDGVNGLITPVNDVMRMEKSLLRIVDNPGFSGTLGQKATEVRERYHPDSIYAQWEAYLTDILAAQGE